MFIGVLTLDLRIPEASSLKEKRSVIKGLKDRIISRFKVAAAEVGDTADKWQLATIGVACVSSEKAHAVDVLNKVAEMVRSNTSVELLDYSIEVL